MPSRGDGCVPVQAQRHYEALHGSKRAGEITIMQLDDALGSGSKLTALVRQTSSTPPTKGSFSSAPAIISESARPRDNLSPIAFAGTQQSFSAFRLRTCVGDVCVAWRQVHCHRLNHWRLTLQGLRVQYTSLRCPLIVYPRFPLLVVTISPGTNRASRHSASDSRSASSSDSGLRRPHPIASAL